MDWFDVRLPVAELVFGGVEDLATRFDVLEDWVCIAWYDRGVVEKVEHAACLLGEDDLFLGALDSGGEVDIVGFLKLLASLWSIISEESGEVVERQSYNVGKLCLSDQALGFCADKLLFELDNLSTLWLLVLQLGDLV
jgi:hypothetical protein